MRKIRYAPIILLIAFIILIDIYVFQGVKVLLFSYSETVKLVIKTLYWVISGGVIVAFLYMVIRLLQAAKTSPGFTAVSNVFITLFVTKLVFMLVLFFGDLFRMVASWLHTGDQASRSVIVSQLALAIASIPFFSFLYGVTKGKYNYKVRQLDLYFDDLPTSFNGFKLVHISDIHAGSFDNQKAVEKGINLINLQQPDLFVFTGDLVNNKSEEIIPWIDLFSTINAKYGKFSILGNHDYGDYIMWPNAQLKTENLERLKKFHAAMGFNLLLDQHINIQKNNEQITLLGVENWGLGFGQRGDLTKALSGVSANDFKVLLSHDPTHWQSVVKTYSSKIHLTLSGHTHGMQFGIEAFGIKWSPVKYRYPHWAGLAVYNERYLYINRGFGFLGFSGRVGIWPEVTVITLRRK